VTVVISLARRNDGGVEAGADSARESIGGTENSPLAGWSHGLRDDFPTAVG
jgi:hypothetical protein